jgi:acyl carrier protein
VSQGAWSPEVPAGDAVRANLKRLIVESLNLEGLTPERIGDDEPLFGQGLGLDSVDALELVVALEKEYGISVQSHEMDRTVFATVRTLADFVEKRLAEARTDGE